MARPRKRTGSNSERIGEMHLGYAIACITGTVERYGERCFLTTVEGGGCVPEGSVIQFRMLHWESSSEPKVGNRVMLRGVATVISEIGTILRSFGVTAI